MSRAELSFIITDIIEVAQSTNFIVEFKSVSFFREFFTLSSFLLNSDLSSFRNEDNYFQVNRD